MTLDDLFPNRNLLDADGDPATITVADFGQGQYYIELPKTQNRPTKLGPYIVPEAELLSQFTICNKDLK